MTAQEFAAGTAWFAIFLIIVLVDRWRNRERRKEGKRR